jgi:3-dehydroquinate synthase
VEGNFQVPLKAQDWKKLIKHSVEFKARVTTEDPKEQGVEKNLKRRTYHWPCVGKLPLGKGNRILHGEAIAVGLITESYLAKKLDI